MTADEIFPSDDEIKKMMTKEHYNHDKGRYRRIYLDRVQGGKMVRDLIKEKYDKLFLMAPDILECLILWQIECDVGEKVTDNQIAKMDKIIKDLKEIIQ